jgi:hypothetical protein
MTPAQPLIPFFLQLAAFERGSAGRREPAKAGGDALPLELELELEIDVAPQGHEGDETHDAAADDAADDECVTIARADLRAARAPQLPRPPLFSQREAAAGGIPARGSSPDLRRR